ncbi:MAG: ATP-NAD kinase [Chloroflexi bacterium]|nr:NAD(+)/NADH kinase [Anaerolineaceae bacterium]NMB90395.1 ATP-NAD kinase [Chloroflexota bacterium]
MGKIGIIANPASGKDIRRLVAHAFVVSNNEKANIVSRILAGLAAVEHPEVVIMPDKFGIGRQAMSELQRLNPQAVQNVRLLDMDFAGAGIDTLRAARQMAAEGAGCIITLGGDGTARLAAQGAGETPVLPLSTGTNNVLPVFLEGTVAGLAAGWVAAHPGQARQDYCYRSKRLEIWVDGVYRDLALVDVAVVQGLFTGSRAVWEADQITGVFVTRASPGAIGLSSVAGLIEPVGLEDAYGLQVALGGEEAIFEVLAPLAPGLVSRLSVRRVARLFPGQPAVVEHARPVVLALDGEREITLQPQESAAVHLSLEGPWIVDVDRVMRLAAGDGYFKNQHNGSGPA